GPCSHHDVVISPSFIRLVDHLELPESKIFLVRLFTLVFVNWLSLLLHKYSGEVLANTIENNEPQYCYHRRRGSAHRIHEHVTTDDIHDDRPKQHQRERYESVHEQ